MTSSNFLWKESSAKKEDRRNVIMDINFLSQDLRPKSAVLNLSKSLRKVGLIMLVTLIAGSVLMLAIIIFFTQKTGSIIEDQNKLTTQIKSLQATEQKLVLVRDRIQKINSVLASDMTKGQLEVFKNISETLPGDVNLLDISVGNMGVRFNLTIINLESVSNTIKVLLSSGFSSVKLSSFSYAPETGYSLTFDISK
jgi:hypothetical protein